MLVNGSLLLDFDFDEMDRVLKDPVKNLAADVRCARDGMITLSDLLGRRGYDVGYVKEALERGFEDALEVSAEQGVLAESETQLASRLVARHRSRDWVYRMDDKRRKRLGRKIEILKDVSAHSLMK